MGENSGIEEEARAEMMHHVRPYKIFGLMESPPAQRTAKVTIPSRRGGGGTTLLETMLIITASRVVAAKRIFEFGTFYGSNTLNLALNAPDDAEILTLDLDEKVAGQIEQHPADAPFTEIHLGSRRALDFVGNPVAQKVKTLTGNSITFDFSEWKESVDFLFIDGGHDLRTVKSDTENALAMAAVKKPACIMWHDYSNKDYPELSGYLGELSEMLEIFHVEDTMLCVWFRDPEGMIERRLRGLEK